MPYLNYTASAEMMSLIMLVSFSQTNKLLVMENVKLELNEKGHGHFYIANDEETIAEITIGISGNDLTVYHTEVLPKAEGKGLAKELLKSMVDYARKHHLKVTALCPYVFAQFKRHPEEYEDIWKKDFQ